MVVHCRCFGGTYRLRVHSFLLLSVNIPEDIKLQTMGSRRHEMRDRGDFSCDRILIVVRPGRIHGQAGHA